MKLRAPSQIRIRRRGLPLVIGGLALVYFLAAKLGLSMAFFAEQITAVWPPTGIALAAVLLFGNRVWPGVFVGAFLANITANEPFLVAFGISIGNTLEAVIGAWLLHRAGCHPDLRRLRDVASLVWIGAFSSPIIAATIGVCCLCSGGLYPWSSFASLWGLWWLGDMMGALVMAPALLTWLTPPPLRATRGRPMECAALFLVLGLISLVVLAGRLPAEFSDHPLEYTVFPILMWAAVRFNQRQAATATLLVGVLSIWGTVNGFGPFARSNTHDGLILLQLYLAVVTVSTLFLAAAISEHHLAAHRRAAEYAVTKVLDESATLEAAAPSILRKICETLGWDVGCLWQLDPKADVLRCVEVWHRPDVQITQFEADSRARTFTSGIGLPGRIWASGAADWIRDVIHDPNFPRAPIAARENLHGAFGFPVLLGKDFLAVIEFFSRQIHSPDEDLLRMSTTIGSQIGQFIERKRAEEAVREGQERLEIAMAAARMGAWEWDLASGRVHWSATLEVIHGLAPGTFGGTFEDFQRDIKPAERQRILDTIQRTIAEGKSDYQVEYQITRPDGTDAWLEARGRIVFAADGSARRMMGVCMDVTARRQAEAAIRESEAEFRQLADAMPQIVWTAGANGKIDYLNQRLYEFTGRRIDEKPELDWMALLHPEDAAACQQAWADAIQTSQPFHLQGRLRGANQEYRWHLCRALPVADVEGRVTRWFGTCTDIHDHKQTEEQRAELLNSERAARSEAERVSRMKDEFLATLSHELRTPLNAILGWSQLLRLGRLPEKEWPVGLETIERNARMQTRLIEDLLDMSRIVSGKVRLDLQQVELAGVLEASLETVHPAAEAKGVALEKDLGGVTDFVMGDSNRLQQVAWNLLSNAIKFTPPGGRVSVRLQRKDGHVELSVSDTGQGIKPEFLPHVFERFRQADSSTSRPHPGLGLGLAIVKHLVELHGGRVRAQSQGEGKGATFFVTLPIAGSHGTWSNSPAGRRNPTDALATNSNTLDGVKVLVVDDDADSRELVGRVLLECKANVALARSAEEADSVFEDFRPHIILSDIGMPGEDGYGLVKRIRSREPANGGLTPLVAITAFARSEDRVRALASGFQAHIAKPVEPPELITAVCRVLGLTHLG